jgi:hypothetical protein
MPRTARFSFFIVFAVALLLRLLLCLVNREANDDHFEVVRIINAEHRIPDKFECSECFQPKLYHFTAAKTLAMLRCASRPSQMIAGQIINGIAGMAIVVLLFFFISASMAGHYRIKFFAFALLALNPALVAINGQATNDTFVILFSTLTFYGIFRFLKGESAGRCRKK